MDFTVRRGTEEDKPEMLRLWREMMDFHARLDPRFCPLPTPAGEEAWEKYLAEDIWDNDDWCVFVAVADGKLVGHILAMLRDSVPVFEPERYGYVTDIVVDPAARRSGVGRALFEALEIWLRERDVSHLQLMVMHNNRVSQDFWRALGCRDYTDILWYDLEAE